MFGLLDRDMKYILEAIGELEEIESVILFGSRAMGNYKKGSDVDIAVVGKDVKIETISKLSESLNEIYPLPLFFDVINYGEISNDKLKEHIDTYGIEIYERE
ncbi:nucleotidyltransferase domain-containing protein [Wukongibacter sp. M2B1]|uniref:nucleotidyltransferase domain-containing protein n=1 Tax=Wukongibacter sp. M2B1 TaxID=3088895 RepID=UPI003D7948DC